MVERSVPRIYRTQPSRETPKLGGIASGALVLAAIWGLAAFGNAKYEEHRDSENRALTAAWSDMVRGKLDGTIPLSEGEAFYPEVKVVPAGRENYQELLDLRGSGQHINVRTFPATYYPKGKETEVVARIKQGEKIKDVVLTKGQQPLSPNPGRWGAFRRGSVDGVLVDINGVPVEVSKETVLAIYEDYLFTTSREPQKIKIPTPSPLEHTK